MINMIIIRLIHYDDKTIVALAVTLTLTVSVQTCPFNSVSATNCKTRSNCLQV